MTDSQLNFVVDGVDYSQNVENFDYVNIEDSNQDSNVSANINSDTIDNDNVETLNNSLQTSEEEYIRQMENAIQQSKDEYQEIISRQQSNNFTIPILPMSMLPENYFSYYNKINQSCDKIIVPQSILYYLFPENNHHRNDEYNDDSHISEQNKVILFNIKSFSVGNQQNIELPNNIICSVDTFLDVEEIYLTEAIFQKLGLDIYTSCNFELYQDILPKGENIVLKPHQKEFMLIKDQEKLLLPELNTHFRTLNLGQKLSIYSHDLDMDLLFTVEKIIPDDVNYISIIDTNLEVEFNIPEDFIEKKEVKPSTEVIAQNNTITNTSPIINIPNLNALVNGSTLEKNTTFTGKGEKLSSISNKKELSREELREIRLKALSKNN